MAMAPSPAKEGIFGTTLVVALVLVLAWQLAYWTWVLVAPPSASVGASPAPAEVDLAAIARLFGGAARSAGTTSVDGLALKGVVAPTPGIAASAIFAPRAGKDISVFIGDEVSPGVKLAEVRPDHVIIARAGARERIDLAAPHSGAGGTRLAARARGFRINVSRSAENRYSLSRKELDEALRDPSQLEYLGQIGMPPGGGVRLDAAPAGSLAAKLGLQPGDVIKKVNGQPVASPGDLARLYQQFATLSRIEAELRRGNATVQLTYQIQ
jgi:general secretion pathway protein C